jgi:hypothetical protein
VLSFEGRVGEGGIGFLLSQVKAVEVFIFNARVLIPDELFPVELPSRCEIITDVSVLLEKCSSDLSFFAFFLLDDFHVDPVF